MFIQDSGSRNMSSGDLAQGEKDDDSPKTDLHVRSYAERHVRSYADSR